MTVIRQINKTVKEAIIDGKDNVNVGRNFGRQNVEVIIAIKALIANGKGSITFAQVKAKEGS